MNAPVREKFPEPLVTFEHADRDAKAFIAEQIPDAIGWLEHAYTRASLSGDHTDEIVYAIRMAGHVFKALRETAIDLAERRRLGS